MIGITKASVFPLPVTASTATSLFLRKWGMHAACWLIFKRLNLQNIGFALWKIMKFWIIQHMFDEHNNYIIIIFIFLSFTNIYWLVIFAQYHIPQCRVKSSLLCPYIWSHTYTQHSTLSYIFLWTETASFNTLTNPIIFHKPALGSSG